MIKRVRQEPKTEKELTVEEQLIEAKETITTLELAITDLYEQVLILQGGV